MLSRIEHEKSFITSGSGLISCSFPGIVTAVLNCHMHFKQFIIYNHMTLRLGVI